MRIPVTTYGLRETLIGTVICWGLAVTCAFFFWPALFVVGAVWVFLLAFFRDPDRPCDREEKELLSPADGTVVEVTEQTPPRYLEGQAVKVSVFMSLLNVHINRSPTGGKVHYVEHFQGKFHDARKPRSGMENEHNFIGLENPATGKVLLNQVAGAVARRIVCSASPGDTLKRGQRLGMIKFGSRVELYVPKDRGVEVLVKPGDKVKAGLHPVIKYVSEGEKARGEKRNF